MVSFDHINHAWLMYCIPTRKSKLNKWLKSGYLEENMLYPTEEGTPQGGIISPTIANMALDGLQDLLSKFFNKKDKIHLVRYADDFIITGAKEELLSQRVKPLVEQFLSERGLSLSASKTRISHIDDGFDFLGFNIRKYKNKLLIKPAKSKYFQSIGSRSWVFGEKDGKLKLLSMSTFPIRRHIKIQSSANPFDPHWKGYFEKRSKRVTAGCFAAPYQCLSPVR